VGGPPLGFGPLTPSGIDGGAILTLHPRAAVTTGSRVAVAVILLVPLGGCAHRQSRSTLLGKPPASTHAENTSGIPPPRSWRIWATRAQETVTTVRRRGRPRKDQSVVGQLQPPPMTRKKKRKMSPEARQRISEGPKGPVGQAEGGQEEVTLCNVNREIVSFR